MNHKPALAQSHFKLFLGGGIFFVVVAFSVGSYVALGAVEVQKFPEQFYIGDSAVGGKTFNAARAEIAKLAESIRATTMTVRLNNNSFAFPLMVRNQLIIGVDVNETMAEAQRVAGRDRVVRTVKGGLGIAATVRVPLQTVIQERAIELADEIIRSWNAPLKNPRSAAFVLSGGGGDEYVVQVVPSEAGEYVAVPQLINALEQAVVRGSTTVSAEIIAAEPRVTTRDAERLTDPALAYMRRIQPRTLVSADGKKFSVSAAQLVRAVQPTIADERVVISLDSDKLKVLLGEAVRPTEREGRDAQFVREGNRVTKFVPHESSLLVDWPALAEGLVDSFNSSSSTIALPLREVVPAVTLDKTNDIGIATVLGYGTSDFKGSPAKRRLNISVGMRTLNGLLIAPNETFSLIKALGEISAATGYVQELVIKGDRTTPEFGGGLCQIGTTTFRAVMGAGFPVVERRNHSFQVPYYFENGLSGTDATIYQPKPDFRFINDTKQFAMLETRMQGDKLTFVFWGTPDGRTASRTPVKVLSTSPAPPKKTIETTEIPVGTVKCTEKAHPGASTIFTYVVTYADGIVKKQDFPSYYKPWGAVCLKGVVATSTPSVGAEEASAALNPDAAGSTGN